MGQHYKVVFLSGTDRVIKHMHPFDYGSGQKMTEHTYMDDNMVLATELCLHQNPTKVVWAGDYANNRDKYRGKLDNDDRYDKNLYFMCNELPALQIKMTLSTELTSETFRYIVNHTKKEYIDKVSAAAVATARGDRWIIHPLPLLTCETDAGGGGDYSGDCEEWVGAWARDLISVENDKPVGDYKEIIVPFREC
jgi:hypothetical protein